MESALNILTGARRDAYQVSPAERREWCCPVCGERVILRTGEARPHFAHPPRQHPECPERCANESGAWSDALTREFDQCPDRILAALLATIQRRRPAPSAAEVLERMLAFVAGCAGWGVGPNDAERVVIANAMQLLSIADHSRTLREVLAATSLPDESPIGIARWLEQQVRKVRWKPLAANDSVQHCPSAWETAKREETLTFGRLSSRMTSGDRVVRQIEYEDELRLTIRWERTESHPLRIVRLMWARDGRGMVCTSTSVPPGNSLLIHLQNGEAAGVWSDVYAEAGRAILYVRANQFPHVAGGLQMRPGAPRTALLREASGVDQPRTDGTLPLGAERWTSLEPDAGSAGEVLVQCPTCPRSYKKKNEFRHARVCPGRSAK